MSKQVWAIVCESPSWYYETEYAAMLAAIELEYSQMEELYYLHRKHEEPSDYIKCIVRLINVDWNDKEQQRVWREEHIATRDVFIGDEGLITPRVEARTVPIHEEVKTEQYVKQGWFFQDWFE